MKPRIIAQALILSLANAAGGGNAITDRKNASPRRKGKGIASRTKSKKR